MTGTNDYITILKPVDQTFVSQTVAEYSWVLLNTVVCTHILYDLFQISRLTMAAAADQKSETEEAVQCMICLEYEEFMECDIKRLPCSYELCTECLFNIYTVSTRIHPCQICR